MRTRWMALGVAVVIAAPAVARAAHYEDETLGFSLNVPQGWRGIPIAAEEEYIVAKWQSEREYVDKKEGWSHRPELKVVLFDPKAKKTAEVKDEGEGITRIAVKNPYRTFKDWVKSDTSGGRYISKEEEITVNGVPTTWYEVAYEKLTVPRHGIAFVYHAADIDYCATAEVLQDQWQKLSPSLISTLKTFKIFPRKGAVKRETTGDSDYGRISVGEDLRRLTPEQRLERKKAAVERALKLATDRLTAGWSVKRSKNYIAITHADDKFTTMVLDQAEGIRSWADSTLPYFGTGLPGPAILRICKDSDEERSFTDLSARSGWVQEITLSRNDSIWGLGNVAGEIFDQWRRDKNPRLAYSLPPWLSNGIRDWVTSSYVKGGKLEFKPDGDLIVSLKLAAKEGKLISPKDMVQMSSDDLFKRDESDTGGGGPPGLPPGLRGFGSRTSAYQQASGFVRYLLAGPGKSAARTKDLLERYVTALDAFVKNQDESPTVVESTPAPKTEEEEEEQFKNKKSYWKDHEKDLLKGVFEEVFREWTDADWTALDKSYRTFAK